MTAGDSENDRTLFVGNLGDKTTEPHLWELFLQAGPLEKVRIPADKDGGNRKSFAFITFKHSVSVPYTIELMNGIRLHGRSLRLQCRSGSVHDQPMAKQPSAASSPLPNPQLQQFNPMLNVAGGFHRSYSAPNMSDAGASPSLMGAAPNFPGMLPPPLLNMPYMASNSPTHTPEPQQQQSRYDNRRDRERDRERSDRRRSNDRSNDRSASRYDPRAMNDSALRGKQSPLSLPGNLNPQQRHMQPSQRWQQRRQR